MVHRPKLSGEDLLAKECPKGRIVLPVSREISGQEKRLKVLTADLCGLSHSTVRRLRDVAEIATGRGRRRQGQGPLDGVMMFPWLTMQVVKAFVSKMELLRNLCSNIYQKVMEDEVTIKGSQFRN